MKKILKKWGNSLVFVFTKEEIKAYSLKNGKIYDIEMNEVKEEKTNGGI